MTELVLQKHPETGEIVPEEWKNIVGYEHLYRVSNYGRLQSYDKEWFSVFKGTSRLHKRKGKIIKGSLDKDGYPFVRLSIKSVHTNKKLHGLVWDHFGNQQRSKTLVIDHRDECKSNNFIGNLQLLSVRENTIKSSPRIKKGGLVGVVTQKRKKASHKISFTSHITVKGKRLYLGIFDTEIEANSAYLKARQHYNV